MPRKKIIVYPAERDRHHKQLVKLAKQSKYISSFGSIMFSSQAAYNRGWIKIAINKTTNDIVGFSCFRNKTRTSETMLYFLMTDPAWTRCGVGRLLMRDLEIQSPHYRIALKVMKDNPGAIAFYEKLGYTIENEDEYKGKGVLMAKEITECP